MVLIVRLKKLFQLNRIKKFIRSYLNYSYVKPWPKITDSKKKILVKKTKQLSSLKTIQLIQQTILENKAGAYMRFGDGDLYLLTGRGELMQEANSNLAAEMREAITLTGDNIIKGFPINSEIFGFEPGMRNGVHKVSDNEALRYISIINDKIDCSNLVSTVALHYCACFHKNEFMEFLKVLKSFSPIFVGNESIKYEIIDTLFGGDFIFAPRKNSYEEINRIEGELINSLEKKNNQFSIVVVAMGCAGRILQKRIIKKGYNVYLFDFGSLMDAFNGDDTRDWIGLSGGLEYFSDLLTDFESFIKK